MSQLPENLQRVSCYSKNVRKMATGFIIILILVSIFFVIPDYLVQAIRHGHSGIHDYKIFDNRVVNTGVAQPWPVSRNFNSATPSPALMDSLKLLKTTGLVVLRDDSLLFEYNDTVGETLPISNAFSVAKSIVGLLVGCAIADGYLQDIHQSVDELLPDLENLHGKGLTIGHLLTMSSGSNWDESYGSPFSITTRAYYGSDLNTLMQRVQITGDPGVNFRYTSGDTQLLAMILTRATGRTLSSYASEKLWQPLGAETPALWSLDRAGGMEKAYCCFNSTTRDFARIGSLVLNLGRWGDKQLVPEQYVIESIRPASFLKNEYGKPLTHYGYQWWILNYRGLTIHYARGLHGQYIFVIPAKNAVIVRLGHLRSDERINDHPLDVFTWINMGLEILEQ